MAIDGAAAAAGARSHRPGRPGSRRHRFLTAPGRIFSAPAGGVLTPVLQLDRLIEIATVLWSSGFTWLVDALGLSACVSLRCRLVCSSGRRSCPHHVAMEVPLPQRLALVLERLGPTYVKAGQLLATRTDHLPPAYAAALGALQDQVAPFSTAESRRVIAEELGASAQSVLDHLDQTPVAAASLAQVHTGRLPDGTEVAVKVQRPDAEEKVEADLQLLMWLARRLERRRGSTVPFRPTEAVQEILEHTRRELDFRHEARTSETVRRGLEGDEGVVVPRVHWDLSSRRVLTMDLVHGRRLAPRAELEAAGLDPDVLLATGARAMIRQVFEIGVFHADPHPGNLLVTDDNRVCFLDFGLHGRLDRRERRRMAMGLYAMARGEYEVMADQLLHLSERRPGADVTAFRSALSEFVESWYADQRQQQSMPQLLLGELGLGSQFGIVFPRALMLLARALVHLEASAALVDPSVRFADLLQPLEADLRSIVLPGRVSLQQLWSVSHMDYLALALELPEALPHLLDTLAERGRAGDQVTSTDAEGRRRGAAVIAAAAGMVAGALVTRVLTRGQGGQHSDPPSG